MRILVTGSVCAGKTTFSKQLIEELKKAGYDFIYWNLSDIVLENGFYLLDQDNERLQTRVVDEDALIQHLQTKIQGVTKFLVDHHSFDIFRSTFFDLIVLVKCVDHNGDLTELRDRLQARGYTPEKVTENLLVERYNYFVRKLKRMKCEIIEVNTAKQGTQMADLTGNESSNSFQTSQVIAAYIAAKLKENSEEIQRMSKYLRFLDLSDEILGEEPEENSELSEELEEFEEFEEKSEHSCIG